MIPPPPAYLTDKAKQHWDRIAAQLAGLGVMAAVHADGLAMLADAMAEYLELCAATVDQPRLVKGSMHQDVQNPLFIARSDAWTRVLKALREFGMTPSAMAGVQIHGQAKDKKDAGIKRFRINK